MSPDNFFLNCSGLWRTPDSSDLARRIQPALRVPMAVQKTLPRAYTARSLAFPILSGLPSVCGGFL